MGSSQFLKIEAEGVYPPIFDINEAREEINMPKKEFIMISTWGIFRCINLYKYLEYIWNG